MGSTGRRGRTYSSSLQASEGRVVGVPKFHSWGKCTMPLTNINSDWMFNASSGLCIILVSYIIYAGPLSCILGLRGSFKLHLLRRGQPDGGEGCIDCADRLIASLLILSFRSVRHL